MAEHSTRAGLSESRDDRTEPEMPCCDYRDHGSGPCACPDHQASRLHPLGRFG